VLIIFFQRDFTDLTVAMRSVFLSPRIARITRIFIREIRVICVKKRNSNEWWSHANLANPAKCENIQFNPCNLLMIFSVNVISQMKQLPCGHSHLTGTDARRVRPQNASGKAIGLHPPINRDPSGKPIDLHARFIAESSLEEGRTGRTSVPAKHKIRLYKNNLFPVILLIRNYA
jgi:hypothetical protein